MITRTLLMLTAIVLTPAMTLADDCNCSCSAFAQLETEVAFFERQLDAGRTALVTPALQTHLQCMNPCAERWTECSFSLAADSELMQTVASDDETAATARTIDSGEPRDW